MHKKSDMFMKTYKEEVTGRYVLKFSPRLKKSFILYMNAVSTQLLILRVRGPYL